MVGANLCDRAVYAHNQLRSRYEGLQKVTWKPELAVTAEATAMKEGTWIGVATVCLDKTVQSTAEQKFSESVLTIAFQEEMVFLCDLSEFTLGVTCTRIYHQLKIGVLVSQNFEQVDRNDA